jgi:tetratricopeptide (TPR) repeat protein
MKKKNVYLLLILLVVFLYVVIDTKLGFIDKEYSFVSTLAAILVSFFSYAWCLEHTEFYKIKYPSKSAFIVAFTGSIGVLIYFFRGFGLKQGLINTLKHIGFILIIFIVAFLALLVTDNSISENDIPEIEVSQGFKDYDNGNYQASFENLEDLAILDNVDAQGRLGWMYSTGNGVPKNIDKSIYWLTKAANQDDVIAQYSLALLYDQGDLVQQDFEEAIKWYSKASEQGYPEAQVNLGIMYATGEGVEIDIVKAKYWINNAYEGGYEKAKEILNKLNKDSH